jgi:hypothetical protein
LLWIGRGHEFLLQGFIVIMSKDAGVVWRTHSPFFLG